jgi:hypothetical protein
VESDATINQKLTLKLPPDAHVAECAPLPPLPQAIQEEETMPPRRGLTEDIRVRQAIEN